MEPQSYTLPLSHNICQPDNFNHVAIIVHGGCFIGGSANWDKQLAELLYNNGIVAVRTYFSGANLESSLRDLVTLTKYIINKYNAPPLSLIGISSGGFLAHALLDEVEYQFRAYIGICPMINPYRSYKYLCEQPDEVFMRLKHLEYFNTERNIRQMSRCYSPQSIDRRADKMYIIAGRKDEIVPSYIVDDYQEYFDIFWYDNGHELCKKPEVFARDILQMLN